MKQRVRLAGALAAVVALIPATPAQAETIADVLLDAPSAYADTALTNANHYAATTGVIYNNISCRLEQPVLVSRGETRISVVGVAAQDLAATSSECIDLRLMPIAEHRISFYLEARNPITRTWELVTPRNCNGNGTSGASAAPCLIDHIYNFGDPAANRLRRACVLLVRPAIPAFQGKPLCSLPLLPVGASLARAAGTEGEQP